MAVKNLREGIRLVPTSSDPASPQEGQLQYSDGTHRTQGLWQFDGGTWVFFAEAGLEDPYDIPLVNPQFTDGIVGWTLTQGASSSATISHETTNPISGTGSLRASLDAWPGTLVADGYDYEANSDKLEATFQLDNDLKKQGSVEISFDMRLEASPTINSNPLFMVDVVDVTAGNSIGGVEIIPRTILLDSLFSSPTDIGKTKRVKLSFTPDIATNTDYKLRIWYITAPSSSQPAPTVFTVDNFKLTSAPLNVLQSGKAYALCRAADEFGNVIPNNVATAVSFGVKREIKNIVPSAGNSRFKVLNSGVYDISANLFFESHSTSTAHSVFADILILDTDATTQLLQVRGARVFGNGATMYLSCGVTASVNLKAGQYISVTAYHNTGANRKLYWQSETYNWITIAER